MRFYQLAGAIILLCKCGIVKCTDGSETNGKKLESVSKKNEARYIRKRRAKQHTLQELQRTEALSMPGQSSSTRKKKEIDILKKKIPRSFSELTEFHQRRLQVHDEGQPKNHEESLVGAHMECLGEGRKQLLVTCSEGMEVDCKQELIEAGVDIVHEMKGIDYFAVCVDTPEEAKIVEKLTDVSKVEDDPVRTLSYIPESKVTARQLAEQTLTYGVDLIGAADFWAKYNNQGEGVTVCVVDTGLSSNHEDISAGDLDGSNDSDLVKPWFRDENSHGTHVAGTIAAVDNDRGVVGVSPQVKIFVARVFNGAGEFTASSLIAAFRECDANDADVINLSLGGPGGSFAEQSYISYLEERGTLLVAAAGNGGDVDNYVQYPASYEQVISVAAVDANKDIAAFSTHNSRVDVSAPGVKVWSLSSASSDSYARFDGTSMASPHVAGAVALLKSQFRNKSPAEIRDAIQVTAEDLGACGPDRVYGHGFVNIMAAATYLEGDTGAASEQTNCVNTNIMIKTDLWGNETSFIISEKDTGDIVYRAGPYPFNEQAIYTYDIQLSPGCYEFKVRDSTGDGTNNPAYGIGEYRVEFDGAEEIFDNNFAGFVQTHLFGCDGGNNDGGGNDFNSPPSKPECGNGVVEEGEDCDDGNSDDGDGCSSICVVEPPPSDNNNNNNNNCPDSSLAYVELFLETDQYANQDNELYFFHEDARSNTLVWIGTDFIPNSKYQVDDCIDPQECYKFYFFDEYGDGFVSGFLSMRWNGEEVLSIQAGESNTAALWDGGPSIFWYAEVGQC